MISFEHDDELPRPNSQRGGVGFRGVRVRPLISSDCDTCCFGYSGLCGFDFQLHDREIAVLSCEIKGPYFTTSRSMQCATRSARPCLSMHTSTQGPLFTSNASYSGLEIGCSASSSSSSSSLISLSSLTAFAREAFLVFDAFNPFTAKERRFILIEARTVLPAFFHRFFATYFFNLAMAFFLLLAPERGNFIHGWSSTSLAVSLLV